MRFKVWLLVLVTICGFTGGYVAFNHIDPWFGIILAIATIYIDAELFISIIKHKD